MLRPSPRRRASPAAAFLLAGLLLAGAAPVRAGDEAQGCAPFDGGIVSLPEPSAPAPGAVAGEVLLALPKTRRGTLPEGTRLGPGARVAASYFSPLLCATVARVVGAEGASAEELVTALPDTAAVVPNAVYFTAQAEVGAAAAPPPDAAQPRGPDPYRPLQYALDQSGVERARSISNGAGVRVAVLDSAPQTGLRDLGSVRLDPFEDGPDPAAAVHGTLVSGVIAATENNGFGMAGVAPGVDLLAIPVCTPTASGSDRCTLYDLLRGLDHAWAREARILNLSIVGPPNLLLERSMSRLDQLGVLLVASAGNEGSDEPRYPAAYPSVLGVGASNRERRLHAGSNRGPSAELLAPGVEILSTLPGDAFAFATGTSFASAQVSGVLGILLGAGAEPGAARAALFQAALAAADAEAGRSDAPAAAPLLPPVCDALARIGRACP